MLCVLVLSFLVAVSTSIGIDKKSVVLPSVGKNGRERSNFIVDCTSFHCVGLGQSCHNNNIYVVSNGSLGVCPFQYACDSSNTCSRKKPVGSYLTSQGSPYCNIHCTQDTDCGNSSDTVFSTLDYRCNLTTKTCFLWPGWANVGDGCQEHSDCHHGGMYTYCIQGICRGALYQ